MDYWTEHVEIAVEEAGITATPDQIQVIAGVIESAHEHYGQSMGHDVASENWHAANEREKQELRDQVEREAAKILCRECHGHGIIIVYGGSRVSEADCWKCRGAGRHDP